MTNASRTVSQPFGVCHVVSSTLVPGRYLRCCGTCAVVGPNRKKPAERSSSDPKMLGASGRGKHIHSTDPSGATNAWFSQSDRNAYSAMGGNMTARFRHGTAPTVRACASAGEESSPGTGDSRSDGLRRPPSGVSPSQEDVHAGPTVDSSAGRHHEERHGAQRSTWHEP